MAAHAVGGWKGEPRAARFHELQTVCHSCANVKDVLKGSGVDHRIPPAREGGWNRPIQVVKDRGAFVIREIHRLEFLASESRPQEIVGVVAKPETFQHIDGLGFGHCSDESPRNGRHFIFLQKQIEPEMETVDRNDTPSRRARNS